MRALSSKGPAGSASTLIFNRGNLSLGVEIVHGWIAMARDEDVLPGKMGEVDRWRYAAMYNVLICLVIPLLDTRSFCNV